MAVLVAIGLAIALSSSGTAAAQASASDAREARTEPRTEPESTATALERAVIEHHARLRALLERYGDRHPDVIAARAELASLALRLRAELAAGGRIDVDAVRAWARAEIADVDARLAELRVTCSTTHVGVRGAQARRAAIVEATIALERTGRFLPEPEPSIPRDQPAR